MKKNNLKEITIMRSLVMLMVISIHFLNLPRASLEVGSHGHGFYFLWSAAYIFAVPCFMFLSMMMVSHKYGTEDTLNKKKFYTNRLLRIGVPYLVWTAIYLSRSFCLGKYTVEDLYNPKSWFYWLFYGKGYDHLYFMAIMFQFYLLTPLMFPIAKKYSSNIKMTLAIAFVPQFFVYWINRLYVYDNYKLLYSSFAWYWSIGFMGLWFGFEYSKNLKFITKHKLKILFLYLISLVVHTYYQRYIWHTSWENMKIETSLYTLNLYFYFLIAIMITLLVAKHISDHWETGITKPVYNFLTKTSEHSYGIYLMHPIFLIYLRKILVTDNPYMWLPLTAFFVPALALLCCNISAFLERVPIIQNALGVFNKRI